MESKQIRVKGGPEAKIQAAIMKRLFELGWYCLHLHASVYMTGMPDLYCTHIKYLHRLVEVKDPKRKGNIFTPAQLKVFPQLTANGSGVWVLTSDADEEIAKLFKPPNWYQYLRIMR